MTSQTTPRAYRLGQDEGEALWFLGNLATVKVSGQESRGHVTVVEVVNPPSFAPPLHRHLEEDEVFYIVSGTARFRCGGEELHAAAGDVVFLPVGLPHTFIAGPDEPLRALQITTPSGFESFAAAVGEPARERRLPDPGPIDPAALSHAAAAHAIEILGPPPEA